MEENELRKQLDELAGKAELPKLQLRIRAGIPIQQIIEELRMWAGYMVFDVAATNRENKYLTKMLEEACDGSGEDEE